MEVGVERLLRLVLVAVVFQCVQVQIASAVACTFVGNSKCKCTLADGSGEIDLSPLFAGGMLSVKSGLYTYTYDACSQVPCDNMCSAGGGCAACQNGGGDLIFGIGSMNSAQIGDVSTSDWNFTMIYTNAAQGKTTHVAYTLATSGGTRFTFTSELPANTYNFAVSGCFDTPKNTCPSTKPIPCKVDSGNPCICSLADGSGIIDLSPIFQGPLVTKGYDSIFLYDACKPIPCGSQCSSCAGCQESGLGHVWGLGTLSSTNISATYIPDGSWALTVLYSNPPQGKRFTVYYTLESSGSAPVLQFVTEITPSNIVFSLHGCFNTPKSSCTTFQPTICSATSGNKCN